jgi:hypothetical protein
MSSTDRHGKGKLEIFHVVLVDARERRKALRIIGASGVTSAAAAGQVATAATPASRMLRMCLCMGVLLDSVLLLSGTTDSLRLMLRGASQRLDALRYSSA